MKYLPKCNLTLAMIPACCSKSSVCKSLCVFIIFSILSKLQIGRNSGRVQATDRQQKTGWFKNVWAIIFANKIWMKNDIMFLAVHGNDKWKGDLSWLIGIKQYRCSQNYIMYLVVYFQNTLILCFPLIIIIHMNGISEYPSTASPESQ